jgi:hypothetical protein
MRRLSVRPDPAKSDQIRGRLARNWRALDASASGFSGRFSSVTNAVRVGPSTLPRAQSQPALPRSCW